MSVNRVKENVFGRFLILHPTNDALAWSGIRWVVIDEYGVPAGEVQVSNFATREEAELYAIKAIDNVAEVPQVIALRLLVAMWRGYGEGMKANPEHLLQVAKLMAEKMPVETMQDLLGRLVELENL